MPNNRISALRHEYGMNQKELGEKLGVGQTTVSAWEKGKNEPDHETLHKMAQLFHCSIGYLTGYENDERTRGLTQEELDNLHTENRAQRELERYERELEQMNSDPPDYEEYLAQEFAHEWLEKYPDLFIETGEIQAIFEDIPAAFRACIVKQAKILKETLTQR